MTPPWEILEGDALTRLRGMAAGSAHACCTSPPYWALRSYLKKDDPQKPLELGSEKAPDCGIGTTQYLELRDDLTAEERAYVIAELVRLGFI